MRQEMRTTMVVATVAAPFHETAATAAAVLINAALTNVDDIVNFVGVTQLLLSKRHEHRSPWSAHLIFSPENPYLRPQRTA